MSYIDDLIANCELAKKAEATREFVVEEGVVFPEGESAIYIIEEVGGDPEKTFLEFSKYKGKKIRACSKLNAPSQVMYVGSSTTGIKRRIKQHTGGGAVQTYALHLDHWFSGEYKITIRLYDQPIEVLQIIEDDLSHSLAPAFGKTGGNNK